MMLAVFTLLFSIFAACLSPSLQVSAQVADPRLTGTWTTKSKKVVTGPDFYDPVSDRLKEPSHPGISYSFTNDGFFEEAYYRVVANPTVPECSKAIMQFQHGKFNIQANGSLVLTPFDVDGRQLVSNPCAGGNAAYYRYNQSELFERYEILIDPFHKVQRLNLYRFDGSPVQPMYLELKSPQMLPTKILNPIPAPGESGTGKNKVKRDSVDEIEFFEPLNKDAFVRRKNFLTVDRWWWVGVILTSVGGVAMFYS
ncbi:Reversal of tor2 lethality [Onygenales sp. PD_12]|nr:Reversal of tor2 lethality [Onygenales sp. PD_12]KAK2787724.1 Reversal of tor2 lethality [Emmonsiellopsis sp. PD_33]